MASFAPAPPVSGIVAPLSSPPSSAAVAPVRLRLANAALRRLWTKGWATMPSLDPGQLIEKAAAKARAAPDDDRSGWKRRLELLCDDLERHAQLSDVGRTIAHGQLVSALASRFRAHALWRRQPGIAARPFAAPIVIVGQMRSGSTRMQRLLACDPRLTYTRFFESWNPIPGAVADGRAPGAIDARKLKGQVGLTMARLLNPDFSAIHPTSWQAPDEEIGLHSLSIYGSAFEAQWRVPAHTAAVEQDDAVPVYREFRQLLQTLCWLRGAAPARPWILKVPQFTQDLAALLQVFPDARLIHLHRDPAEVVASATTLVCNQMRIQSHEVDPAWVEAEWARKVRLRTERVAMARARSSAPEVDVGYHDVTRDWAGEMERVYRMLRLPLTAGVLARMRRYMETSASTHRPRHGDARARSGAAAALARETG